MCEGYSLNMAQWLVQQFFSGGGNRRGEPGFGQEGPSKLCLHTPTTTLQCELGATGMASLKRGGVAHCFVLLIVKYSLLSAIQVP